MMKEPLQIINHLSPTDALAILRALAGSDGQLAAASPGWPWPACVSLGAWQ